MQLTFTCTSDVLRSSWCNLLEHSTFVQRTSRLITPNVDSTTDVKAGRTPNVYATGPRSFPNESFSRDSNVSSIPKKGRKLEACSRKPFCSAFFHFFQHFYQGISMIGKNREGNTT